MKKILAIGMLSLTLFSTLSFSNSLESLVQLMPQAGVCGYPPEKQPNFCSCFIAASVAACQAACKSGSPPCGTCNPTLVKSMFKTVQQPEPFCARHQALLPKDVSLSECAADITYIKQHC